MSQKSSEKSEIPRPWWIIPAVVCFCLFGIYSPIFFRRVIFYSADSFAFYFTSLRYWLGELASYGTLPFWNPYSNLGTSFLYNTTNAYFYPFHLLGFFLTPYPLYQTLWAIHLLVLGAGVIRWANRAKASWGNCLLVASLFVSSPFVSLFAVAGFNYLYAMTWSVWILGEWDASDRRLVSLPRFLLFWTLLLVSGEPFCAIYLGCFFIYQFVVHREWYKTFLFGIYSLAVGILIYGHGILAVAYSTRKAGLDPKWILAFSFHPFRLLTFLSPYFFGHPLKGTYLADSVVNSGPGAPRFLFDSVYLPTSLLVLIALGLTQRYREKRSLVWITAIALGFFFSFGNLGPMRLLCYVPPFSMFRYPEKFTVVAILMLLHFAFRKKDDFLSEFSSPLARALMFAGVVLPCLSLNGEYGIALATLGIFILAQAYEKKRLTHSAALGGMLILGFVQGWLGLSPERSLPVDEIEKESDVAGYVKNNIAASSLDRFEVTPQVANRDYPHKYLIYGTNMLTRRSTVFGYDSFMTPFLQSAMSRLTGDTTRFNPIPTQVLKADTVLAFMKLTNLKMFVVDDASPIRPLFDSVREDAKVFKVAHRESGWTALVPFGESSSLWWFSSVGEEQEGSDLLHWPPTVEKKRAFFRGIEREWKEVTPPHCDSSGQRPLDQKSVQWTGKNEFLLHIQSPCDGWIFFSQTALPGWRLYFEGEEKPLYRMNKTFMGFLVPKGKIEGNLRFTPFQTLYEGLVGRFLTGVD